MAPRRSTQPTPAELEILQVVWQRGSASVREVFEVLRDVREIGYTTVLKLMQIMHEKDLLRRDASARSHRFAAALKRERMQRDIVASVIDRAFNGSAAQLVEAVLAHVKSSRTELAAIHAVFAPGRKDAPPAKRAAKAARAPKKKAPPTPRRPSKTRIQARVVPARCE
jgi:BlaI family penicillinase repressor